MAALRRGAARILVATDVAARGLDEPDLGLVVHYDVPRGVEAYVHRTGRTGRAGRSGTSVALVAPAVDAGVMHGLGRLLRRSGNTRVDSSFERHQWTQSQAPVQPSSDADA